MIYFDENKQAYGFEIEHSIATIDDETWQEHCTNPYGSSWDIIGNQFTDLTETEEYKNKIRLKEIETELKQADKTYQTVLDTPVEYTNGLKYKPTYAESYVLLIASGISPVAIWDSSELNVVEMTTADLTSLTLFLKNIAEPAFQTRKETRKSLLEEKEALESSLDI